MRILKSALVLAFCLFVGFGVLWSAWAHYPLQFNLQDKLEVNIKPGSSLKGIGRQLRQQGVPISPTVFKYLGLIKGLERQLKAGSYELHSGLSPSQILSKIAAGDSKQYAFQILEGWTFAQLRAALSQSPYLQHTTEHLQEAQLMTALNAPQFKAEGLFFPETYFFEAGSTDLSILRRAYDLMQQKLQASWASRDQNLTYQTPYQALIAASLIEKETGLFHDRPHISAVFNNRLRLGMPLQTDPSVIYGLKTSYHGRLRKEDLRTDSPYNTYTRRGLPPTPIALPGLASIAAALHPARNSNLYFVGRGDGSSQFSVSLQDHNQAVNQFIRTQK